jgi:putative ABC transport system permease protein
LGSFKAAFFLAYKSILKGNIWALLLVILVMALSFANLILTPAILSGLTETMDQQQVDNLYSDIVIDPEDEAYYLDHVARLERQISAVPGVASVSAHLVNSAFFEYQWEEKVSPVDRGNEGTWQVIGVDPDQERLVTEIHNHIIAGSYLEESDRDGILLGVEITGGETAQTSASYNLGGVSVGDKVRLTFANGIRREYSVRGIFQAREIVQADHLAFITRTEMASVMGRNIYYDRASQLLVKVEPGKDPSTVLADIQALGLAAEVKSWREYGDIMGGIVSSFDVIASLIGGIGLVVAGTVMFIIIYINVVNKRRHIGILRAIGIRAKVIIGSYLIHAFFYAVLGIICGGLVYWLGLDPYFRMHPLELALGDVSLAVSEGTVGNAVTGLLLAAAVAGLIPVLHILRQSIVKAIWGN